MNDTQWSGFQIRKVKTNSQPPVSVSTKSGWIIEPGANWGGCGGLGCIWAGPYSPARGMDNCWTYSFLFVIEVTFMSHPELQKSVWHRLSPLERQERCTLEVFEECFWNGHIFLQPFTEQSLSWEMMCLFFVQVCAYKRNSPKTSPWRRIRRWARLEKSLGLVFTVGRVAQNCSVGFSAWIHLCVLTPNPVMN